MPLNRSVWPSDSWCAVELMLNLDPLKSSVQKLPVKRESRSLTISRGRPQKKKPYLKRYSERVRYALIVTIKAPGEPVDLYTPVKNIVKNVAAIES